MRTSTSQRHQKLINDFRRLVAKKDAKGRQVNTTEFIIGKLADKHCYSETMVQKILKSA